VRGFPARLYGRVATRVDHVSIAVPDLRAGAKVFTALGFELDTAATAAVAYTATAALHLVAAGEPYGFRSIALAADHAREIDEGLPLHFVTDSPCSHHPGRHPNGALHVERVYIVVPDLEASAEAYARCLDLPAPPRQRGNVIKADMRVFDVGPVGIGIAQPSGPGPAAEALERNGPGPFQVLLRTRSLTAAATWIEAHGLPRPLVGTRNTGEQAMLVRPEHAFGVFLAFVGAA
jgi:catechol 2,3-dioxygenase-like lactoylglutathione lyase family enzyme